MQRKMIGLGLVAAMVAVVVYVGGCATLAGGKTVMRVDKGGVATVGEAPRDGQYVLLGGTDLTPKMTVTLKEGEALGFKRDDTGQTVAVWGSNQQKYPDGTYYWKFRE